MPKIFIIVLVCVATIFLRLLGKFFQSLKISTWVKIFMQYLVQHTL